MKGAGSFWVMKKHRDFFGCCTFHQLKSSVTAIKLGYIFTVYLVGTFVRIEALYSTAGRPAFSNI